MNQSEILWGIYERFYSQLTEEEENIFKAVCEGIEEQEEEL